jgi:hypothetical protein
MDYEEIVYSCNCQNHKNCYLDCKEISWDRGEITEVELPIYGGFTLDDNTFISIADFMEGSSTKLVRMVLRDHYGDEVNVQEVLANSPDIEYYDDHISCYFSVDDGLSKLLAPGSYVLYVYIQNIIPSVNSKSPETTVFNEMVTGPEGLEIIIS